jgi:anti-anti-sigma factor
MSGDREEFRCETEFASFVVRRLDGTIDVIAGGELDIASADGAALTAEHVAELVAEDGSDVTVDLSDVTFLDASAIAFVLRLERITEIGGTHVVVDNPSPLVRRLLRLLDLERLLSRPTTDAG